MTLKAKRDGDELAGDGLTDEPPQRVVSRMLTWAGVALALSGAAVMAARTQTGQQRLARLFEPAPAQVARTEPQRQERPVATDPLLVYETRRLAEAVRQLSAERDQLLERVTAVERSVGDVTTASIPREGTPARPVARVVASAPVAETPAAPAPAAQDSTAMRTEFGVDIAGDANLEALRTRWQQLRAQHGPLLEGLRPVVTVQEAATGGGVQLRLVAGPLGNANSAARLCVTLSAAGVNCKPAIFDGQRLALR